MGSGGFTFESKLIVRRSQIRVKKNVQGVLQYLADYWSNRDPTIIVHIAFVSLTVLHNRDNSTEPELTGDTPMKQHLIEKAL